MRTTYFLKIGFSCTRTQGSSTFVLSSCARLSRPSMRPEFRILLILLQAHISEISKLCNNLATENQAHKAEIAALNKRFEMDTDARKAKAETKNAAQLAEFIQSDMWEVITNGTTVSSLTILGVLMTILWRKIMAKIGRLNPSSGPRRQDLVELANRRNWLKICSYKQNKINTFFTNFFLHNTELFFHTFVLLDDPHGRGVIIGL